MKDNDLNRNMPLSVLDFFKRSKKQHQFDNEILDENGTPIPILEQVAMVTHFLQLRDSHVELPYSQLAKQVFVKWKRRVKVSVEDGGYEQFVSEPIEPY